MYPVLVYPVSAPPYKDVPIRKKSPWLTSGWDLTFYKNLDFEFALGGPLGGFWVAGLELEILPKTTAFTSLNLSPIGLTKPPFVKVFGWDLGP